MSKRELLLILCLLSSLIVACKRPADTATGGDSMSATTSAAQASSPDATPMQGFDIKEVPVSNVPLGEFPYFNLPAGYTTEGVETEEKDFARFPFWVRGQPVWVEGKFYLATFSPEEGKSMSEFEVKKNFDAMISQLGGVKISEEQTPYDTIKSWGDEIEAGFLTGLGDVYNNPTTTYVIHRDDGNIWVHLVTNTAQGWYIVGQEKSFQPTASLLPAAELKRQLDDAGKVALQVNFATDKTDILPESQP
jgi:hypothetical protein